MGKRTAAAKRQSDQKKENVEPQNNKKSKTAQQQKSASDQDMAMAAPEQPTVGVVTRSRTKHLREPKPVHDQFMEEVHAKEQELNKHCLIMGQVETEEDETTLEQLRALTRVYVPQQVQDAFVEVWEQLDEVGEDSEEEEEEEEEDGEPDILGAIMKAMLGGKMLNTKHAAQMHTIIRSHLDTIDGDLKSKQWEQAFCRWAALLQAFHRERHWYEDTDVPEESEAIYKRMRQMWLKLKARSDQELGGLVAEGGESAKEEFSAYLQAVADDMRSMGYEVQDV